MPENNTELELKLRLLAPDAWAKVFSVPVLAALATGAPRDEHLESWYFDTPDSDLQTAGLAYRIRLESGQWVATVKAGGTSAGGLHVRREWNIIVAEPEPGIACFANSEAGPLLAAACGDEPLVMQFSTVFDRRITDLVTADGSRVELAVDRGMIIAGGREEPIAEVELELKEGQTAAVLALGAELARALPVAIEPRSKYLRALIIAGLADEAGALALAPPALDDRATDALYPLIINHIHLVLAAGSDCQQSAGDAEALHRLRISIRRLRSLLSLAKPVAEPAGYEAWQEELRSFGRTTDSLRETDVILARWRELTTSRGPLTPPPWLGLMLETERDHLARDFDSMLQSGRLTTTILSFWAWIATVNTLLPPADVTLAAFAVSRLTGWLDNMRQISKDVALDDVTRLHRLRIQIKKLRYVMEGLPLRDRKSRLLLSRLKKLQDSLGHIRDSRIIDEAMSAWMGRHASRIIHRDAGMLTGWTARAGAEASGEFDLAWQRFKRASRRWQKDRQ